MAAYLKPLCVAILVGTAPMLSAQTTAPTETAGDTENLLTQAELETLVAPVALYPDTLLIQILVAATYPLEVIKADRLVATEETDPEVLKASIEAEGYDPSVEVLAIAFPQVIGDMATHIEWTEAMGDAMLAQSDDVMTAIQTMRAQAINSGALIDTEQQVVEVTDDNVIIAPANPDVVYVPQYDPQVVYVENTSNVVGDALLTGAIAFGTFAIMDAIFGDDDYWGGNYWGCRNCGGWGGGPIIRNPNIDIDIDGNVNIGNKVDINRDNIDRDRWGERGPDGGWQPDTDRQQKARDQISKKRGEGGATQLPVNKADSAKRDKLRSDLAARSGAADISRPGGVDRAQTLKGAGPGATAKSRDTIARTGAAKKPATANRTGAPRPQVKKPAAQKMAAKKPATRNIAQHKPNGLAKKAPANRAKAASNRGRTGGGKGARRR